MFSTQKSALDLLQGRTERGCCLSFGDRILDDTAGGGIFTNGITEISGEAGAGKTQFCLCLSLQCHLDRSLGGLGGSTVYLSCGEGLFPDRRLDQLSEAYAAKYRSISSTSISTRPLSQRDFLNNVHVLTLHHTGQAQEVLSRNVPELCQQQGVRLLIVDSLAGMARTEFDSSNKDDMKKRTAALFGLASKLKWLADTFSLCVIVVNQVTAGGFNDNPQLMGEGAHAIGGFAGNDRPDTVPALGLVWTTCVNTRITLRRHHTGGGGCVETEADSKSSVDGGDTSAADCAVAPYTGSGKRTFHVELSLFQGPTACAYIIAGDGIHGLHPLWSP